MDSLRTEPAFAVVDRDVDSSTGLKNKNSFCCPYCGLYAFMPKIPLIKSLSFGCLIKSQNLNLYISECPGCYKVAVWHEEKLVIPVCSVDPEPNKDMPQDIREIYEEARQVFCSSPRCSLILLRLALEKLCDCVLPSCKGKPLNEKIASLVKNGLPDKLQKAFDFIRISGNNAAHEFEKNDIEAAHDKAMTLFKLLNIIVERMITEDRQIENLYNNIPKNYRDNIKARDKKVKKNS